MKHQNITNIARILRKIFSVLVAVNVVALVYWLYIIMSSLSLRSDFLRTKLNSVLEGIFSEILQKEITQTDVTLILFSLLFLLIAMLFLLINIKKLLHYIEHNATPFQVEIVRQIRKVILWWMVVSLLPLWKISDPSDPLLVISFGYHVLFAVVLYLISLIFEYGISLQTEVDETL